MPLGMFEHEAMVSERSSSTEVSTAASKPCFRIMRRTRLRFARFFYIPFVWQRAASINELLLLEAPIQPNRLSLERAGFAEQCHEWRRCRLEYLFRSSVLPRQEARPR